MGRGQYDRAAAKAKRAPLTAEQIAAGADLGAAAALKHVSYARPAFPYENKPVSIVNGFGQPVSQADYDALVTKADRLLRLCQTHGLMIDG